MQHRGRYLRSWAGALEWFLGGAAGVGVVTALQYGLGGEPPGGPAQIAVFVLVFGVVGAVLRRWRGGQLIDRGAAALDASPEDRHRSDRSEDGRPGSADDPGQEFGTSGSGG
jgi:hypothetical protein